MFEYAYWTITNTVILVTLTAVFLMFIGWTVSEIQHLKNKQDNLK